MPGAGTLTDAQIAGYAKAAGFTGDALVTAIAVCLAESGGNPRAHNGNALTGDDSYGLMQINMLGSLGPDRRKRYGLKSNDDLYDPSTNMRVAFAMSNGGKSFSAWSTYPPSSNKYKAYVPRANAAAGNPDTSGSSAGGTANAVPANSLIPGMDGITSFFSFISDSITWLRAGMILAGAVLLIFAAVGLSGQGDKAKLAASLLPEAMVL